MRESAIYDDIRLAAATHFKCVLKRNNNGVLRDRFGTYVRFGLGVGTGDLIGFVTRGGVAVFVSVEVKKLGWTPRKTPTKTERAQELWRKAVNAAGGIGLQVTSVEQFVEEMQERMP